MERKQYLVKNTALFVLNVIGTRLISFLLVPLYTNAFTTLEYGTIDIIATITTILVPVITINIGEAVMRFALDEDSNKNDITSIAVFFLCLSLLLGTIVVPILSFFPNITVSNKLVYVHCISQGIYQTFSYNLRGQEKLFQFAVGNILNVFLTAILNIFFLFILKIGISGYFYAYIISYIISAAYCFFVGNVLAAVKEFHIDKTLMKNMAKYSIVLVPNSFMWWIMNSSDHVMVTSMIGMDANGIYAVSYKLPSILSAMSIVFNQAWSYSAIQESKSSDKEAFNNAMYDRLVRFQLMVTIFLMVIMKPFMKIYVQPSYFDAWKYTPYLLVGNFFLTMGTFLSTCYTVNKDSRGFLFSGITGAVINIMLNWIFIPKFGIHGAALATCISYISVFLYRVKDTKKYIKIHVFKPIYIVQYLLLVITAISMAIPSVMGQIIMLIELILVICINYHFIIECFCMMRRILSHFILHR